MSPIFFVIMLAAAAIVATLIILTIKIFKRTAFRVVLIIVALISYIPLTMALLPLMVTLASSYRYNVTPDSVPTLPVPPTATRVSYRFAPTMGTMLVVEFQVTEAAFLEWMSARGWTPETIQRGELVLPLSAYATNSRDRLVVTNGYRFAEYDKNKFDDSGTTVVFDRNKGMAFIKRTRF